MGEILQKFTLDFHWAGALAANVVVTYTAVSDCQLLHVSAVASNDSDGTISIGNSTSAVAYLVASVLGDSQVPAQYELADFVGAQYPHIPDGTIVIITIDFDGASGTAAEDVTVVLTFSEG